MKRLVIALRIFLFFTLLTGFAYPLLITGAAHLLFASKARGSMIYRDGKPVGSALIGESFDSCAGYFSSRPSAVSYNTLPSGASNYGPTNKKLEKEFRKREKEFIEYNLQDTMISVPSEMLFASASGLDPHISPLAALLQVERISRARHFSDRQMDELVGRIDRLTEWPQFLCLGKERVNVLLLNLETDKIR